MVIGCFRVTCQVVHRLQVISRCCLRCQNSWNVYSLLVPSCDTSLQHCMRHSLHAPMAGAQLREHAIDIYNTAVTSVLPRSMVAKALKRDGERLTVGGCWHTLHHNVHIVAFGKAVIGMVRAAEEALGDHIVGGIASIPHGIQDSLKQLGKWDLLPSASSKVQLIEGGVNNLPDDHSYRAAMNIHDLLQSLTEDDLVLALVSGGGSALLPAPVPPVTLSELTEVTRLLARAGATIYQLNTLRKHLELMKGGGLAKAAYPAKVIALIISDVVGNDLGFISSGPTVPDFTTPQQCLDLLDRFGIMATVPRSVVELLNAQARSPEFTKYVGDSENNNLDEAVEKDQAGFHCDNVQNVLIGSNEIALQAAEQMARDAGYGALVLSSEIVGDAEYVGNTFARFANYICQSLRCGRGVDEALVPAELELIELGISQPKITALRQVMKESAHSGRPICILAAGETTVQVRGNGTGGRCQQMALSAAIRMHQLMADGSDLERDFGVAFLAAGTDGQDGPTDAAGALADPGLLSRATMSGIEDAEAFLKNNDSYTFFSQVDEGRNQLKSGLTGMNVMDLQILLVAQCNANTL